MPKEINFSKIKAFALDLDGTCLLPDHSLGEKTAQILKRKIAEGIKVIVCTGRAIESSSRYYNTIGAQGPMVFFNGAVVADVPNVKTIESRLMDTDIVNYAIDLARNMDIHLQVFLPPKEKNSWEALVIDKMRPEAEFYQKHTGVKHTVTDMKAAISEPDLKGCIKAAFITDPCLHDEIRRKMLDRFGSHLYIARTHPTYLEIMDAGVSKGEGLKTVMRHHGFKPEEVMAFGDEENDLPMFAAAGCCAAPSNAKENIRNAADFVFGSSAEEGFAAFLEENFN